MTLLLFVLQLTQSNNLPWSVLGTMITIIGGTVGYFIKQDKQISKQADRIALLEASDKEREGRLTALSQSFSKQVERMKSDIMAEFKVQERETRDIRERMIRMEERILQGIKKGSNKQEQEGP